MLIDLIIENFENQTANQETKVDLHETKINAHGIKIADLEEKDTAQKNDIKSLQGLTAKGNSHF